MLVKFLVSKYKLTLFVISLIYLLLAALASLNPLFLSKLIDELSRSSDANISVVVKSVGFILLSTLLSMSIGYILTNKLGGLSIAMTSEIRRTISERYLCANHPHVPNSGEYITVMLRDCTAVVNFTVRDLNSILVSCSTFVGVSVVLFRMSVALYCFALAFVPIYWFAYQCLSKKRSEVARTLREKYGVFSNTLTEISVHRRTVLLHRALGLTMELFERSMRSYNEEEKRQIRLSALSSTTMSGVSFVMTSLSLLFGIPMVIRGDISVGILLAFFTYAGRLVSPVAGMTSIALSWLEVKTAITHIDRFMHLPQTREGSSVESSDLNSLILHDVDPYGTGEYAYNTSLQLGSVTSFIGQTGAGKSTLCRLMAGYLYPISGKVMFKDANGCLTPAVEMKDEVILVDTDMRLFENQSLTVNITLNRPVTYEEIKGAIEAVSLQCMLDSRDIKLTQIVKDVGLSHGEMQRVLLARAYLLSPKLLILDEAMSGIDPELSLNILDNLSKRIPQILIVSHRQIDHSLSTKMYSIRSGCIREVSFASVQ